MQGEDKGKDGVSRRTLLKIGAGVAAAGAIGVASYQVLRLLPPGRQRVLETFVYVKPEGNVLPLWYEDLVGQEARIGDFQLGRGASVLWRTLVDEGGGIIPLTGFPGLLIRVDESGLVFPVGYPQEEFVVQGVYAIFDCCTHTCCRTGWQLIPRSSYAVDLGYDTIYCVCHDGQFDPRRISDYRHPPPPDASGAVYIGVSNVEGPPERGMPLIPIRLDGDKIVGEMKNPDWYRYLDFRTEVPG